MESILGCVQQPLPPSVVSASHLIALGEEELAAVLRTIQMEGSPLLPATHRSPLGLKMTLGPRVAAVALARSSPVLIRHIPSMQPRGLFPAVVQVVSKVQMQVSTLVF